MTHALYTPERLNIVEALIPLLQNTSDWDRRYEIEWYVGRCVMKGFCKTQDQMRLCAERYIAGKRKVTPPGTARRKLAEKKKKEFLKSIPPELNAAIEAAITEQQKAVEQYRSGVEKALNSIVGGVMKRHRSDPAIVKGHDLRNHRLHSSTGTGMWELYFIFLMVLLIAGAVSELS